MHRGTIQVAPTQVVSKVRATNQLFASTLTKVHAPLVPVTPLGTPSTNTFVQLVMPIWVSHLTILKQNAEIREAKNTQKTSSCGYEPHSYPQF